MREIGQGLDVQRDRSLELGGPGRDSRRTTIEAIRAAGTSPSYNIAAVARLSGVLAATLRAWERRYGYPSPRRTESNRRGYSDHDVLALRWLRERLHEGLT